MRRLADSQGLDRGATGHFRAHFDDLKAGRVFTNRSETVYRMANSNLPANFGEAVRVRRLEPRRLSRQSLKRMPLEEVMALHNGKESFIRIDKAPNSESGKLWDVQPQRRDPDGGTKYPIVGMPFPECASTCRQASSHPNW